MKLRKVMAALCCDKTHPSSRVESQDAGRLHGGPRLEPDGSTLCNLSSATGFFFEAAEWLVWICVLKYGPGSSMAADSEGAEAGGWRACCNKPGGGEEGLTLGCGGGDGGERAALGNI